MSNRTVGYGKVSRKKNFVVFHFYVYLCSSKYKERGANLLLYTIRLNFCTQCSGSSLDMYICIHVRDKGIYSRGI